MGQAKARGSFAVRQAEGSARLEAEALQRKQEAALREARHLQERQDAAARREAQRLAHPAGLSRYGMSRGRSLSLTMAAVAALSVGFSRK